MREKLWPVVAFLSIVAGLLLFLMVFRKKGRFQSSVEKQGEKALRIYSSVRVAAIIPAHNEADVISTTIRSLFNQTRPPDQVLVVADNCTDNTVALTRELQREYPLEVMETIDNRAKKAGALNQGLAKLDPSIDYVLVMDADTILDSRLLEEALNELEGNPRLGAVCSRAGIVPPLTKASPWKRIIWQIQHLEYGQFDSQRVETLERIKVVHGMAAVYRRGALRQVARYRELRWGRKSQVYVNDNLVEDYELTLTLKEQGWEVTMSMKMLAWTNVPLSIKALWRQRLRWLRGGVDTLRQHGWNKVTRGDVLNHGLFIFLFSFQILVLVLVAVALGRSMPWSWSPWLVAVLILSYLDGLYRLKYVQDLRLGDVLIRVALIPEMLYGWFQMVAMLCAYVYSLAKVDQNW